MSPEGPLGDATAHTMRIWQYLQENWKRYLAITAYFIAATILPGLLMLIGKIVIGL